MTNSAESDTEAPSWWAAVIWWVIVVPGFSALLAWVLPAPSPMQSDTPIVLLILLILVSFWVTRAVLGYFRGGGGLIWQVVSFAITVAIVVAAMFGTYAPEGMFGARVEAVVSVVDENGAVQVANLTTGEQLGTVADRRSEGGFVHHDLDVGDTVRVAVPPWSGASPITAELADRGLVAACSWAVGWLVGAAVIAVSVARQRRRV